ncbi:diguanylate cyclase [Oceanospirillum sp.]|uniref:GGDEF domain-containing protein n=1 Tax=Oceanospirillum sp. TaxID=2021254 RepID=UPI003A90F8A6
MQNMTSGAKRPHIRRLLQKLTLVLVIFVICALALVTAVHRYSISLIDTSQKELLPAIHDHQRAALNLERLERMGDLVAYGGSLTLIRKNTLAAQVLAFQPSFDFNQNTRKTVRAASELLREIRRTRQPLLSSRAERLSSIEYENLIQLEQTLQKRWDKYKQELFDLQNKIISNAIALQTKNMQLITATNNQMLIVSACSISMLLLVVFIIGYNLYKHLITPVTEASQALAVLEQQTKYTPLKEARYQELHNIRNTVNSLSGTMKKLHEMATRDALTGCINRGYFMERAQQILAVAHRTKSPMAMVMLDVDHFKRVNDRHGHAMGDDTLKFAVKWISSLLPNGSFIGRMGGEEFAMAFPGYGLEDAVKISDKIRSEIEQNSINSGTIPAITVSLGVDVIRDATDEVDKLLSQADKALYQAKAGGRNQVVPYQAPVFISGELQ